MSGLVSARSVGMPYVRGASGRSPEPALIHPAGAPPTRSPFHPGRAAARRTSRTPSISLEPGPLEQRRASRPGSSHQSSIVGLGAVGAHRQHEPACRLVPAAPAPRCRARARASGRASRRCRSAIGMEDVEREHAARRRPLAQRLAAPPAARRRRAGAGAPGTAPSRARSVPSSGRSRMSASIEPQLDAVRLGPPPRQLEHHRRASTPTTEHAGERGRHGHAARSRHRPRAPARRGECQVDVEGDVLGDRPAPGVVAPAEPVVGGWSRPLHYPAIMDVNALVADADRAHRRRRRLGGARGRAHRGAGPQGAARARAARAGRRSRPTSGGRVAPS